MWYKYVFFHLFQFYKQHFVVTFFFLGKKVLCIIYQICYEFGGLDANESYF